MLTIDGIHVRKGAIHTEVGAGALKGAMKVGTPLRVGVDEAAIVY